jgi:hypothetical protein
VKALVLLFEFFDDVRPANAVRMMRVRREQPG